MIKAGTRCRVLDDNMNNFNRGDIVVALENDNIPYCCLLENYDPNKSVGDYNSKLVYPLCSFDLEVIDDDWTEE